MTDKTSSFLALLCRLWEGHFDELLFVLQFLQPGNEVWIRGRCILFLPAFEPGNVNILGSVLFFIHAVRDMLGHRDISSTNIYSQLVNKQLKDVYNKAHPQA